MCLDCGCGEPGHTHDHTHTHGTGTTVEINADVLAKNDRYAGANRRFFEDRDLFVVNLISSPGSGKTTLMEALAEELGDALYVVTGDLQTSRDAERIIRAGTRALQIETGGACHLDAHTVGHACEKIDFDGCRILIIENVGNLVCPAAYDLGEHLKVSILSVPEGDDKILKYPPLFTRVGALIINKIDLLPYVDFNVKKAVNECRSLNHHFHTFEMSARNREGIAPFIGFLEESREKLLQKAP